MAREGVRRRNDRLRDARTVVAGTVTGIESVDRDPGQPISHHEPIWIAVKIHVDTVLKGDVQGDTVVAEVALSPHPGVAWAPRPEVGQSGVWLLHEGPEEALVMEDPLDYQPFEAARELDDQVRKQLARKKR